MPEFAGLGTSLVLIVAVVLWVAYLVPVWTRKREYLATERNAIRLQQTLRIMAESAESPEEVRIEADARTIAVQQKAVAKEARLKQAMEHAKAVARARELDEQIKAVEREVRAAVKSTVSRAQRLRRTRLACFALVLTAVVAVVAGAIVPGLQALVALGAVVAVLGLAGLVAVNASASRMRRVASSAPEVRTLVEAREVAAEAVAAESRVATQVVARQATRAGQHRTGAVRAAASASGVIFGTAETPRAEVAGTADEATASRAWSPRPVPEQRLRPEYRAGDELLRRARAQLAEDRRAISGPIARVAALEASFDEIVTGEIGTPSPTEPAADRRTAETQPVAPVREMRADPAPAAPAVIIEPAPLETEQDEHRVRVEQPARRVERSASGSRFASMGVVDDELERLDVHEAFLRRVG
ncbi:hypothetical protein [Agrococcus jenensis]|uniref:DUF3040 family protein n=1 Tax=Agrococcus jenensis TaxID=46353 RepID=A0A3N2AT79_9MICO|nr:hypothetical protein [Agrococcus jenensis]ROR66231.1 hypothetical protein EDD26_1612 [Agrococcus jenensis]